MVNGIQKTRSSLGPELYGKDGKERLDVELPKLEVELKDPYCSLHTTGEGKEIVE